MHSPLSSIDGMTWNYITTVPSVLGKSYKIVSGNGIWFIWDKNKAFITNNNGSSWIEIENWSTNEPPFYLTPVILFYKNLFWFIDLESKIIKAISIPIVSLEDWPVVGQLNNTLLWENLDPNAIGKGNDRIVILDSNSNEVILSPLI